VIDRGRRELDPRQVDCRRSERNHVAWMADAAAAIVVRLG
jgi:hypothetical protein